MVNLVAPGSHVVPAVLINASPAFLWFVVILFFVLLLLIPGVWLFLRWFYGRNAKPNPDNAVIYVQMGQFVYPPVKGKRYYSGQEGDFYNYVINKEERTVAVAQDYGYSWLRNRRIIDVVDGMSVARSRHGDTPRKELSGQDLSNLTKGYVFQTLVASLKASIMPSILVMVLIAAVAAGLGFFGAKYMGQQQTAATPTTTQGTPAPGQGNGGGSTIPQPNPAQPPKGVK